MVDSIISIAKPKARHGPSATHGLSRYRATPRTTKNSAVLPGEVETSLHDAVMSGDAKLVERLVEDLSAGSNFNLAALDGEGLTVMHQAVFSASLPVLDVLLRYNGGEIDTVRDEEGCTLLHAAAMVGNCLLAGWLIKEGASVMVIDSDGQLPIDLADDLGMQELLLQAMRRAGYVGLALHYKARLEAWNKADGDDSDYGTASSMSSLTLDDRYGDSDDERRSQYVYNEDIVEDDDDNVRWREETETRRAGEADVHSEKFVLNTSTCLAAGVISRLPVQSDFISESGHRLSEISQSVESIVLTVRRPLLMPRVEVLPTKCKCTALDKGYEMLDIPVGLSRTLAQFHMNFSRVLQSLQTSAVVQEDFVTMATSTAPHNPIDHAERAQQIISCDNTHTHPVTIGNKLRTVLPSKPAINMINIRRSQTVSEADVGWVPGPSTHSLRSDAGCRSQLKRSVLSSRQGDRWRCRRKNVSFPVEVLMTDAVGVGDVDEVRLLLDSGAIDINSLLPAGLTALHLAVLSRQRQIVQFLLAHGASLNSVDVDGWKPLHAAAREGTVPITNTLLENGADPLALTEDGKTALMLASNDNVRLVLRNAMERALQPKPQTAVDVISNKNISGLATSHRSKLRSSSDDSYASVRKSTMNRKMVSFSPPVLLHQAIIDGDVEEVHDLLEDNDETVIALNSTHLGGVTALHQAVLEEQVDVVRLLLKDRRVNVDLHDTDGWTAMHAAAVIGTPSIVELLIEAGASVNLPNGDGQLPLELTDNDSVAALLRRHAETGTT